MFALVLLVPVLIILPFLAWALGHESRGKK